MARTNNALTQSQSHRLYAWLDESRVWASETTAQRIAVKAAEELKFGVTVSNVLSAKRALNIVKPQPVAPVAECRCRELAGVVLEWVSSTDNSEITYQRYVNKLREIAVVNPQQLTLSDELRRRGIEAQP
jgi:hypothetical protein